jgi:hypothetical protein
MKITIVPVHHFYGPMKGAEFTIPNKKIALDILKDERIGKMERNLYRITGQAWRFKIVRTNKEIKGIEINEMEEFFNPKGENFQLLRD